MKKIVTICLLLATCLPVGAVENGQVMYEGGTVGSMKRGAMGRLDTASQTLLTFEYPGGNLVIPYAKIDSYEISEEVARHLGALPALAVILVRKRQRRHFLRVGYRDERDVSQVAVFEVPKQTPRTLAAVMQTRAPQARVWTAAARLREGLN